MEPTPGLPDIKECEMCFQWRPLFPHDEAMRDATCPEPSEAVRNRFLKKNRNKSQMKVAETNVNQAKAEGGVGAMLLLDPQIDQLLDGDVDVDNCDEGMFGFDIDNGGFDNDLFGFELGRDIFDDDTRNK